MRAGGAPSRTRTRSSASTTRPSTAPGPDIACGWRSARHRRDRLRGQPPARRPGARRSARRGMGALRRGGTRTAAGVRRRGGPLARGRFARSRGCAAGPRGRAALGHLSLRRHRGRAGGLARARARAAGQRLRHRQPSVAPRARSASPAACWSPDRRWSTARAPVPLSEDDPLSPDHAVRRQQARAGDDRRRVRTARCCWPVRSTMPDRGSPPITSRPPLRSSSPTSRPNAAPPVLAVGNLESRRDITDVRDTVRAYQALVERGRSRCAPTTSAADRRTASAICSTSCCRSRRFACGSRSTRRGFGRATTRWSSAAMRG